MVYGYVSASSRGNHTLNRQIENVKSFNGEIIIFKEAYKRASSTRPEWDKLLKSLNPGDTLVFDSVTRISRSSEEAAEEYFNLIGKGVELIFLKNPYLNSRIYRQVLDSQTLVEDSEGRSGVLISLKKAIDLLAKQQVKITFEQAEKEASHLKERAKEGLKEARAKGKVLGRPAGTKNQSKRGQEIEAYIKKNSRKFGGSMTDQNIIDTMKCSKHTLIKYKRMISEKL